MNTKPKILFVIGILGVNGATKSLMSLLKALPSEEYDISLFLYTHDGYGLAEIPRHVTVLPENPRYAAICDPGWLVVWKALKRLRFDALALRLFRVLRRRVFFQFDILDWLPIIRGDWDVLCAYADGLGPVCLNRIQAKKKLFWVHCDYVASRQSDSVLASFRRADGAVAVSKASKARFLEAMGGIYEKPLSVVHNLIDPDNCRRLAKIGHEGPCRVAGTIEAGADGAMKFRIVSVGRLDLNTKGFDLIPRISAKLRMQGKSFEWLVVGGGSQSEVEKLKLMIAQHEVRDCVRIVGEVSNPFPLLDSADIVVQPSRHESWGMTVSEALILGKPVVVSNIPSFCEQVRDCENGLVVELDATKFAVAIMRLMDDGNLRRQLGEKAREYPFSAEMVRDEFRGALESCN